MNVKDLILHTPFEDIMSVIKLYYGDSEIAEQKQLYDKLRKMTPKPNVNGTTIFINAFLCNEEEDICLSEFNEFDTEVYFDVSANEQNDDTVYSIASAGYEDLFGYYIDEKTKNKFSEKSILAHILWEVSAYAYEDFGSNQ